jgi:hypothetical protein
MEIYKYKSYEHYVEAQTKANKKKLQFVWVKEGVIKEIIKNYSDIPGNIICHGTRNATKQKFFKKNCKECNIIGTEISETAKDFPMTVQWDFHEANEDWIGKFDIVYSNSFDHSYDPNKSISTWRDQLSEKGTMYIEWCPAENINICRESDPSEVTEKELKKIFTDNGLSIDGILAINGKSGSKIFILKKKKNEKQK